MEDTLKKILAELQKVNTRLDGFDNRLDGFDDRLDGLDNRLDGFDNRLNGFDNRLDGFNDRLDGLDNRLDGLENGQQVLMRDVSSIKDNLISGLGPYFEHIEKHIDEKTYELKDILEDQQRVIETLSVRSIKHESEIKDFKEMLKNQ
ncbi:hypothetical protein [Alkalihalobacterium chitinilyticum]|uniref:t-SNARE coiled-coil homology domain-containing protein n=1 Tax=Alkalihalobacterium chitinilyticum TaxID=2980103 RepID=A0ABT5VHV7_9BACI|nr:hypothetical protein [Alkalihalobacterium chitinilyticum]MDE5415045.1 hypothetical protein [Alkalihalobacterium chitinilyticum]